MHFFVVLPNETFKPSKNKGIGTQLSFHENLAKWVNCTNDQLVTFENYAYL